MSSCLTWKNVVVSPCETHHLFEDKPIYDERYSHVLKYHEPGLAPAKKDDLAFHINLEGQPAYPLRFIETFGFYSGLAAVRNEEGWFHINESGKSHYLERYLWCGNFQEGFCPVKEKKTRLYFHINEKGERAYQEKYCYVGDFKEGRAVVCNDLGLHTHIDYQGNKIHPHEFLDLDHYHKGFARAKDSKGWFHVNKMGNPIYNSRYAFIEPFYNGVARVETFDGQLLTINIQGEVLAELRSALQKPWQLLSGDMVGFWRTETIAAAVRLDLFDCLPASTKDIALKINVYSPYLEYLLRALWELNIVYFANSAWHLTERGNALTCDGDHFMASASLMWSDINTEEWKKLSTYIRLGPSATPTLFKATATDEALEHYHRAIDGYALEDYQAFNASLDWDLHHKIIGVGRSAKTWLEQLLQKNPHQNALLLGENYVIKFPHINPSVASRFRLKAHDILESWPEKAEIIILPKILHYYSDEKVLKILTQAEQSLLNNGKIYIIEMIPHQDNPNGSLLALNMLVECGGQLRFFTDWINLSQLCQLSIKQHIVINPWLNMLVLERNIKSIE